MHIPAVRFSDKVSCSPRDDGHAQRNYEICNALDLTSLNCVLPKLVEAGMHPRLAEIFEMQAQTLRALILSENNRLGGF